MATEHSMLRSSIDSLTESVRLLERFNKRDINYVFTADDLHSIRGAATMASQGAKSLSECSGYLEAKIYLEKK